jgi:Spy/CpxP family protein refolding chaperone
LCQAPICFVPAFDIPQKRDRYNNCKEICNPPAILSVISYETTPKVFGVHKVTKQNMKRNLLTFAAVGAMALGGFAVAQGQGGHLGGFGACHGHGFALEHLTKTLNLTSDQQTKVQPIIDQARPQIIAIHKDAMQKTQAVMTNTTAQIRPLLNPDQQKKLDDLQKAHQDLMNAMKEMHSAQGE